MADVDFKLWVAGEELPIKQLKGQLNLGLRSFRRIKARRQRDQVLKPASGTSRS
jgi:hypothetical protein